MLMWNASQTGLFSPPSLSYPFKHECVCLLNCSHHVVPRLNVVCQRPWARCCLGLQLVVSPHCMLFYSLPLRLALSWLSHCYLHSHWVEIGVYLWAVLADSCWHTPGLLRNHLAGRSAQLRGHLRPNRRWMSCLAAQLCLTGHANVAHTLTHFNKLCSVR